MRTVEYRGFTIKLADSGKSYETFHPKEGELKLCGFGAISIVQAKEMIDRRMDAAEFVLDFDVTATSH